MGRSLELVSKRGKAEKIVQDRGTPMSFAEIGRRFGVSEATALYIYNEGMRKLRQTLREYDGTAEDLFSFLECDTPRLPGIKTRAPNVLWFGSSLDCTTHPEDSTDDQIAGSGLEP